MSATRSKMVATAEGHAREGRLQAGVEACFQALSADPEDAVAQCLLAKTLLDGDFYDQAIDAATEAIEKDPTCSPSYLVLGLAYDRRGGMWDQSILVWHELAEVEPDLVTAHVQLGEAFAAANFEEESIDAWRTALALDPTDARAMYNLALAALAREGPRTSLPGFRKAGELDPSQDELFFFLSGIAERSAQPPDPDRVAPDRGSLLTTAGALLWHEELFSASELVRRVLDDDPEDVEALGLAAYAYLKQESGNEAMACALQALMLSQDFPPALYCLGASYARHPGLDVQAARVWSALARTAPTHPMPHVLLAEALMGLQRYGRARREYEKAVELDPACVRARFGLAAAFLTEGRRAEAAWETRRAAYYDTRRQDHFWRLYDAYVGKDA